MTEDQSKDESVETVETCFTAADMSTASAEGYEAGYKAGIDAANGIDTGAE